MKNVKSILEIGNGNLISNTKAGATIYNAELFAGLNDKEKKSVRVKLRRKLDNFVISAKQCEKNTTKLEAIRKDWNEYAKLVYKDASIIIDANAREEKINDVKYFLALMDKKEIATASKK